MSHQKVHYQTYSDIEIFEGTLSSHRYPWHYHECYSIILVETGSISYFFERAEMTLGTNDIFIINPYESHYNAVDNKCKYKVIFLPVHHLADNVHPGSTVRFERSIIKSKLLFQKLSGLINSILAAGNEEAISRAVLELPGTILQNFCYHVMDPVADERILSATEYINRNLHKKLSIEEISRACWLSKFHFQRVFKSCIGLTVNDYIQQQRTALAKRLVKRGSKITDTAYETGYFDPSHFNKAFKKMWVATPASFK
jgi:AraC-like DNA-binding protein